MTDGIKKFEIELREENFQAWLKIFESNAVTLPDVAEELKSKGITQGIKGDFIRKLAGENFPFGQYLIAEGKPPVNGRDASVECLVKLTPKPIQIEAADENSRYFPICITNVTEGQKVVRYLPPTKGEPGISVLGKEVLAVPGKGVQNPRGMNTDFLESDPTYLIAKRSGNFDWDGVKARIEREYIVSGDISIVNGFVVEFVGDLKVTGDIKIGITLIVGGNLSVQGAVEDVNIECGGTIQIKGGIFGSGQGRINCKGSLDINHAYNQTLRCGGDLIIRKETMSCQIFAKAVPSPHGSILGGTVTVQNYIEVRDLGKEEFTRTTVVVGGKNQLGELLQTYDNEILELDKKIKSLKEVIFKLAKDKLTGTDYNEEKESKLNFLRNEMDEMHRVMNETKDKRTKLQIEIKQVVPKIIVYGAVYPNVHMTINDASIICNEPMMNFTFYEKDKGIVKFKNSQF